MIVKWVLRYHKETDKRVFFSLLHMITGFKMEKQVFFTQLKNTNVTNCVLYSGLCT